ncbi:hypothetical protein GGI1_10360 [Acidithiobacillus sp. GGI-221]|nr:hypothetical protein GGI1_10360 [Acidithiobacillus sp. GGI-221]
MQWVILGNERAVFRIHVDDVKPWVLLIIAGHYIHRAVGQKVI